MDSAKTFEQFIPPHVILQTMHSVVLNDKYKGYYCGY